EAPFVVNTRNKSNKSANIYSDPENVSILKYLNVNVVCLANNHIFDYGREGLEDTIKILNDNNIEWFGVYDKDVVLNDLNLVLHGYCSFNTDPIGVSLTGDSVSALAYEKVVEKFSNYDKLGLTNVICNHSGVENVSIPSLDDIKFARYLSNCAKYIYIGHHPHVIQPTEKYNDSYISYSLGNFCFDDIKDDRTGDILVYQNDENKKGLIKSFDFEGDGIHEENIFIYQGEDKLKIVSLEMDELSVDDVDKYNATRNAEISDAVNKRNSKRDFRWLSSRVSFSTLVRVICRQYNAYKYKKFFSSKLEL
ncbi:CapA family protein, partial [Vibrio sinaloensis]|uniref:CapA family protein n=2 Tax=Photobacterium sp. (strain ATCC 43367) TaxID=379097 RepID=UPI002F3E2331